MPSNLFGAGLALIDKLPLCALFKKWGNGVIGSLVSQILVVISICLMAFTDPSMHGQDIGSRSGLQLMAVLRYAWAFHQQLRILLLMLIELNCLKIQMFRLFYGIDLHAGYRIATIIAQLGALCCSRTWN